MRSALVVTIPITMLISLAIAAADVVKGLSDVQFEYALRNISTAPNYVLVTVVDGNTGTRQSVCMQAESLLGALCLEHDLKWEAAVGVALAQPDRVFRFSKTNALKCVVRAYSDQTLQETRNFLAEMTIDEIEAATHDQRSKFYEFCARNPGAYGSRFAAVAHVLAERGILCVRGCKPGIFGLDRSTHNRTTAPGRESTGVPPGR